MTYLSQSRCHTLSEELFGTKCKLGIQKGRSCIYVQDKTDEDTYNLIGWGIGWHEALLNAKENAKRIIDQATELKDKLKDAKEKAIEDIQDKVIEDLKDKPTS